MHYKQIAASLIASLSITSLAYAKDIVPNELTEAFKNGTTSVDFRLRHENSRQNPLEEAKATTLRSVIGYETAEFSRSTMRVELVDVANLFGQRYNPGLSDLAKPGFTTIRDPKGAGVTEGKLTFNGIDRNVITLGRQYLQFGNERFIGKNNFRQFPQSFDAFGLTNTMVDLVKFNYYFLTHVNTNFANGRTPGGRRSLSTHLLNADWNGYQYGTISAYLYFNKDRTVNTNSHTIWGFRIKGSEEHTGTADYTLELARQQNKFGNPNHYVAHYMLAEIGKTIDMFSGLAGVERLSGNSSGKGRSFITPLGSVDQFNGMAQVFTITPDRGLQDFYGTVAATHMDLKLFLTYHYFRLDKGPGHRRAGQEVDVGVDFKLNEKIALSTGYAKYNPKRYKAPITRRFWVMLNAKLI